MASDGKIHSPSGTLSGTMSLTGSIIAVGTSNVRRFNYLMACMSMTIGLSNLWRFPYICYENGGGAFLIPYMIVVVVIGVPIYFFDMCAGQMTGMGTVKMFRSVGVGWTGIGICQSICCFAMASYYAYLLAIAGVFIVHSCQTNLPWADCDPEWGKFCVPSRGFVNSINISTGDNDTRLTTSSELFLNLVVLKKPANFDDGYGVPDWKLCVSLIVIWILTGIDVQYLMKFSYKLSYVNIATYILIGSVFIYSLLLSGGTNGLSELYKFTPGEVFSPMAWREAGLQCFYSLGIGYGIISDFASYNVVHARVDLVSYITNVLDVLTSFLNIATVFSMLGVVAHTLEMEVDEVLKEGAGMTMMYVLYPAMFANFDYVPQLVAVAFFALVIICGIGNLACFIQMISNNMLEAFPKMKSWQVTLMVTITCCMFGVVYTTPGGLVALSIVDYYANLNILSLLSVLQTVAIIYTYGLRDWCWNVAYMLNKKVNFYFRWTWTIITPIFLIILYLGNAGSFIRHPYNYELPNYVIITAWMIFLVIHIPLFVPLLKGLITYRIRRHLALKEAFKMVLNAHTFGHRDENTNASMKLFRERKLQRWHYIENPPQTPREEFIYCLTKTDI